MRVAFLGSLSLFAVFTCVVFHEGGFCYGFQGLDLVVHSWECEEVDFPALSWGGHPRGKILVLYRIFAIFSCFCPAMSRDLGYGVLSGAEVIIYVIEACHSFFV